MRPFGPPSSTEVRHSRGRKIRWPGREEMHRHDPIRARGQIQVLFCQKKNPTRWSMLGPPSSTLVTTTKSPFRCPKFMHTSVTNAGYTNLSSPWLVDNAHLGLSALTASLQATALHQSAAVDLRLHGLVTSSDFTIREPRQASVLLTCPRLH